MAVPRKKVSKSRKNTRRAHDRLTAPNLVNCAQCSEPKKPHCICPKCGYYNGREIISITAE